MVVSFLKVHFSKRKPTKVVYCDYKSFRNEKFRAERKHTIINHDIYSIERKKFSNIF